MTWGWVNYQDIFLWMWTNPLTLKRQRIWIRVYTPLNDIMYRTFTHFVMKHGIFPAQKLILDFHAKPIKPKPNDSDKVLGGSEGTSFTCSTASLSQSSLNSAAWNCHNTSVIKDLRKLRLRLISMLLKDIQDFLWPSICECKFMKLKMWM